MIKWKKYYIRKKKKRIQKKYTLDLSVVHFFNQDKLILNNNLEIFWIILKYFKVELKYFLKSLFKKYNFNFTNMINKNFYIKKDKIQLNQIVSKYLNSFLNPISVLEKIKTNFYQICFYLLFKNFIQKQDFLIFYVIYFNFSGSNTNLQITDSKGKSKIFYSAGLVNLKGKQKVLRRLVLVKLFNILTLLKLKFIKNYPVALHLKNVGSNKFLILKKLKRKFFIKIIKTFELSAYNGCRKKKERRKRQKKLKRRDG
jgi:hypothetical protein